MTERPAATKSAGAFRTIGEVAEELKLPQHVLRFWETRFPQVKPLKRGGGRRFYRPEDVALLRAVQALLYGEGYTIKGVQRLLKEFGAEHVADALARSAAGAAEISAQRSVQPGRLAAGRSTAKGDEPPARRERGNEAAPTAPSARPPPVPRRADPVERLETALADMIACERLLASLRSGR